MLATISIPQEGCTYAYNTALQIPTVFQIKGEKNGFANGEYDSKKVDNNDDLF